MRTLETSAPWEDAPPAPASIRPLDPRWRSALKSLTWRLCASALTALLVFAFTGRLSTAITLGGIEGALKLVLFYLHERAWCLVPARGVRRRPQGTVEQASSAAQTPSRQARSTRHSTPSPQGAFKASPRWQRESGAP